MKKRFIVTLLTLGALCVGLTGCSNADSSSPAPPPETTTTTAEQSVTTTTSQTEPTTTSSEVTSSTSVSDVTESSVTSSEVTTTTTTTAIVTEPKVTTATKKQTTTTKVTTTAKPKTTTTTTTTTTKKVDDSKYKMTGIMACYDRLRRGVSTAEDRQKIIDDLCQYTVNRFDGKSGEVAFQTDCTSKEACDYFGYSQGSPYTLYVEVPIKIEIVDTFNFDNNALLNVYGGTQSASWSEETAEEAYYLTLLFQHRLYATAECGIASYINNMSWNEWGEGYTMPIYFCIENKNYTTGGAVDWWTVWFLCGG